MTKLSIAFVGKYNMNKMTSKADLQDINMLEFMDPNYHKDVERDFFSNIEKQKF